MRFGADWSGGWPGIGALQGQGMSFAGRYLAYDHPRGLQEFELQALNAAGFDLLTYYEEYESSIMEGWNFGVRAGQTSLSILSSFGIHNPVPLNIACDTDITASQIGPVFDALDGLASVIDRENAGIYGGVVPVHLARANGKATYGVQAGAWRYRAAEVGVTDPYGWSPYAQCRQDGYNAWIGGINCDHLTALAGDFGQWRRPDAPPALPPDNTPWDPNQFDHNPVLREGMKSPYVTEVAFLLNAAMGAKLAPTDTFTHDVYQAVYFWQGLHKMATDGVVGQQTWHSLGVYAAHIHRFDAEPTVALNDSHTQAIKDLQVALNAVTVHGFTPLLVDGAFGPHTRDAVAQYQRNMKLTADGVVGPATWVSLAKLMTKYGK